MDSEELLPEPVTALSLLDVSMVKDPGMQAILLLARSLDWNVLQKPGNPVVITSREGITRRVPTNTSVRASLFQTLVSSVILHSSLEPSTELIEKIIKAVKPNHDQARRLRLAIGEEPSIHAERLENATSNQVDVEDDKPPLEETIELEWAEPPADQTAKLGPRPPSVRTFGPADHQDHGKLLKERTHLAKSSLHKQKNGVYRTNAYESNTSNERLWEDGYVDFTCKICGLAFMTSRGVGSHKQQHIKEGIVEADSQRERIKATGINIPVDELWGERPPTLKKAEPEPEAEPNHSVIDEDAIILLQGIKAMLFPEIERNTAELMAVVDQLRQENEELRTKYTKVSGDLRALRELIGGMGDT